MVNIVRKTRARKVKCNSSLYNQKNNKTYSLSRTTNQFEKDTSPLLLTRIGTETIYIHIHFREIQYVHCTTLAGLEDFRSN